MVQGRGCLQEGSRVSKSKVGGGMVLQFTKRPLCTQTSEVREEALACNCFKQLKGAHKRRLWYFLHLTSFCTKATFLIRLVRGVDPVYYQPKSVCGSAEVSNGNRDIAADKVERDLDQSSCKTQI